MTRENSFQFFNIDHLSASAVNKWIAAPGLWGLQYIGGVKDKGAPRMWCGSACDTGLAIILRNKDIGYAIELAHQAYDLNCAGETSDEIEDARELIEPVLRQCLHWKPPGPLNATQLRIEHYFDPIPIPFVGYLDFAFGSDAPIPAIDIDLKVTKQIPSAPRADHLRQVSLYRAARGRAGGLLYVSAKKHAYYEVDDESMGIALEQLRAAALSLQNFLARCDSREDVLKSLPIDWDHWQAPKTKVSLSEVLLAG